jgi:hypothetical protein
MSQNCSCTRPHYDDQLSADLVEVRDRMVALDASIRAPAYSRAMPPLRDQSAALLEVLQGLVDRTTLYACAALPEGEVFIDLADPPYSADGIVPADHVHTADDPDAPQGNA